MSRNDNSKDTMRQSLYDDLNEGLAQARNTLNNQRVSMPASFGLGMNFDGSMNRKDMSPFGPGPKIFVTNDDGEDDTNLLEDDFD